MSLDRIRFTLAARSALPVLVTLGGFLWWAQPLRDTTEPFHLAVFKEFSESASDVAAVNSSQNAASSQSVAFLPVSGGVVRHLDGEVIRRIQALEDTLEQAIGLELFNEPLSLPFVGGESNLQNYDGAYEVALLQRASGSFDVISTNTPQGGEVGLGGAESECSDDSCDDSLPAVKMVSPSLHHASHSRGHNLEGGELNAALNLSDRFDRVFSLLKFLPIGTPVAGRVSSGFGGRKSPFSRHRSFHYGIDLSVGHGGRVVSTGAGTVVRVGYHRTYGTVVDIEHIEGLVTRYAHLARALVRLGQPVIRGQLIALSGSTGRSTGPHLHYEVIHNGQARDPEPFVQLADRLVGLSPLVTGRS